jgi:hypothetical protein
MNGRRITTDPNASSSDPSLPGFLARPAGSPVYHGFVVVPETCIDGWCLGVITEFEDPAGCTGGDAFVIAPDGSRAGLVWEVGGEPLQEIMAPDSERWGVYAIWFPSPTRTVQDLVNNFRFVLPQLKEAYARVRNSLSSNTSLERTRGR